MGVCARVTPLACAAAKTHTGGAPSRHRRRRTKIETKVHPRGGGGPSPLRVHSTTATGTAETNDDANSRRPVPLRQPPAPPTWTYLSACVCVVYSLIIVYTLDAIVFVPASSYTQQRSQLCIVEGIFLTLFVKGAGQRDIFVSSTTTTITPLIFFCCFNEISGPQRPSVIILGPHAVVTTTSTTRMRMLIPATGKML